MDYTETLLYKQLELPFVLTNTVRVVFLGAFSVTAFAWSVDMIEPVDPFKILKPAYLDPAGSVFVGIPPTGHFDKKRAPEVAENA